MEVSNNVNWELVDCRKRNNALNGPNAATNFEGSHVMSESDLYVRLRQIGKNRHVKDNRLSFAHTRKGRNGVCINAIGIFARVEKWQKLSLLTVGRSIKTVQVGRRQVSLILLRTMSVSSRMSEMALFSLI